MSAARRPPFAALLAALLAAWGGCGPSTPTQLVVLIDGDLRVPDDVDALVVRTSSGGRVTTTRRFPLGAGRGSYALPGGFGVVPVEGDAERPVTVEVDVMLGACRRFTYRAPSAFDSGRAATVRVYLSRRCAGPAAASVCAPRDLCASDSSTCGRDGACVDARGQGDATPPSRPINAPTHGAAIAVAPDDGRAVVALRRSPHVAVLNLDLTVRERSERHVDVRALLPYASVTPALLPADEDPEGWATVISTDSNTAWVVLRRAQRVLRIDDLRGTPRFARASTPTGSEPTGIALSPSGRHLYVTNFGEGTVTVIAAATMGVEMTLDLNGPLARSGRLGAVDPRPALAHPRGITISNDGDADDHDEVAWVTEFYGQWRDPAEVRLDGPPLDPATDPRFWDLSRVGVMYRIPLDTHLPDEALTVIPPVASTGFADAQGNDTGCFPNLLYAPHWNRGRVFVTGTCASPAGPVGEACRAGATCDPLQLAPEGDVDPRNHQTLSHAAVFVIDASTRTALPTELLTRRYWEMYTRTLPDGVGTGFRSGAPDDAQRRMPLLPLGMAFPPGETVGYVLGYGSDAVFRAVFDARGRLTAIGSDNWGFIDLDGDAERPAHLPVGIATNNIEGAREDTAFVLNAESANVSVINLDTQRVERVVSVRPSAPEPPEAAAIREGRRFFVTGLGRMSWRGQAWSSCETCHPDGLSDGVTWFFPRGPRQSPSLDGSFVRDRAGALHQRLFGWNAHFDQVQDVEAVIRSVSGGVGGLVHDATEPATRGQRILFQTDRDAPAPPHTTRSQFNLASDITAVPTAVAHLARLEAYVQSIRAPRAPTGLAPNIVAQGRLAFANYCTGCHGSPLWSAARRFFTPSESLNATGGALQQLRYIAPRLFPIARNPALDRSTLAMPSATFRAVGADDHVQCAVRDVGTFGGGAAVTLAGVPVREVRQDMSTPALGELGFSPPSLLGLSLSAPYLHAGNARTLEGVFDHTFQIHHKVWCQNCFNPDSDHLADDLRAMVYYLLSLDDGTESAPVRAPLVDEAADLCAQWRAPTP